jgi:hypothetical protein
MDRMVAAHTPLPPDTFMFRAINGSEGLSMLFEFEIELLSESYALDLRQLLGKPVGRENATSRLYIYRATARPWLWYPTQTSDSRYGPTNTAASTSSSTGTVSASTTNSSCWVPVSRPWASGGFGGIQLPRRGDEVVVDFIGGHPDRPIVIGSVYNGSNMPPWNLPANATQSGFLSRTQDGTPRTANAFMFENKPGQEEIWLHAERNMRTEVEADERRNVDGSRTTTLGGDDTTTIGGARTIHVQGTDALTVGQARSVTVTDDETYTVNGARKAQVSGGMTTENFDQGLTTTVAADGETRTVTGLFNETLNTGQEVHVTSGNALHDVQAGIGVTVSKAVVSAIKTDIFGMSSKIGATEYKTAAWPPKARRRRTCWPGCSPSSDGDAVIARTKRGAGTHGRVGVAGLGGMDLVGVADHRR